MEKEALWHKVIKDNHAVRRNGWNAGEAGSRTFKSPWRSVFLVQDQFFDRCDWKVQDGSVVGFWEDLWVGGGKLSDRFPGLARLCPMKSAMVNQFAIFSDEFSGKVDRDLKFPRNLSDREAIEYAELIHLLEPILLWNGLEERSGLTTLFPSPRRLYTRT